VKDLPIFPQGLPAVFMAGWRAVFGKSGCCEEECKRIIIRNVAKALYLLPHGTLNIFRINDNFIELFNFVNNVPKVTYNQCF